MIQMLGSSDKDFKAAIQKVLWQEIINSFEMNENIENLNKEKKLFKKEPNWKYKTEQYKNWKKEKRKPWGWTQW